MKKTLFAIAACSLAATAAHAQSSVTLYGIVDAGITYTNLQATGPNVTNGKSNVQMTSGNLYSSRWGLKGNEDLGGGLAAVFTLENGFTINNGKLGQGGEEFGRQAYVGLSNAYGTLTAGRQYDSMSDIVGVYASSNDWASGFGSHFGDIDNLNQSIRINNALKYVSPTWNGLSLSTIFGFGGVAGQFATNRAWAAAVSYATGPFSLGAGYLNLRNPLNPGATLSGQFAQIAGNYEGSFSSDYLPLQVAQSQQVYGAGASYTLGQATVNFVWTRTQFTNDQFFVQTAGASSGTNIRFDNFEINGKYMLTPAWTVGAAYIYTDGKANSPDKSPKFGQINLGTNYNLSKRTTVYLVGTYQKAFGDGIVFNSATGGFNAIAETPELADSSTSSQVQITAGIKHSF